MLKILEIPGAGGDRKSVHESDHPRGTPLWVVTRYKAFIPTDRLEINMEGPGTGPDGDRIRDGKAKTIESQLSSIFERLEKYAVAEADLSQKRREEAERTQANHERALAEARSDYRQSKLFDELARQVNEWEFSRRANSYLQELDSRIAQIEDVAVRQEGEDWISTIRLMITRMDPLSQPIRTPLVPIPSESELTKHLRLLGH